MVDQNLVAETVETGDLKVHIMYDNEQDCSPFDCDMPKTWGIDLSNHRNFPEPYGDEMPVSMEVACDPDPEDKWDRVQFFKNYYVLPIYMYEHSGITISAAPFSCPWDSGMAGFAYIKKSEFCKDWQLKKSMPAREREKIAIDWLTGTIKELDYHFTGQVYGFVIEDEDEEELESCWGFIGELEYCKTEALEAAAHLQEHR